MPTSAQIHQPDDVGCIEECDTTTEKETLKHNNASASLADNDQGTRKTGAECRACDGEFLTRTILQTIDVLPYRITGSRVEY